MKNRLSLTVILLVLSSACQRVVQEYSPEEPESISEEVSFYSSDSIKIIGDLYVLDEMAPTLLLFHQGGSNARGEYGSIIPRLIDRGFNILAIDQRMGGQTYGSYNRTLAYISDYSFENPYSYCDVYDNLEAALDFIIETKVSKKNIVWGSSYSASLAILLAARNPDKISGVLAFSPASGGPMAACQPDPYFELLEVPLLLLRPSNELANQQAKAQFELAMNKGHQTYIATHGTHGASMLVEARVGHSTEKNWTVVWDFLDQISRQ